MNYQLLALDLDGTLLQHDCTISEEDREAVEYARDSGVQIVVCTGRSFVDAEQFQTQLIHPADWIISCNGTNICKPNQQDTIFDSVLSQRECEQILQICKKFHAKPQFISDIGMYTDLDVENEFRALCKKDAIPAKMKSICFQTMEEWDDLLAKKNRFSKALLNHEDAAVFEQMMQALKALNAFELSPTAYPSSRYINVEICSKGIHKGAALQRLAQHLGYEMDHVMAIGDSSNDLQMLEMSGFGIAMGNAPESVKGLANACTAKNAENGVAKAIRKYL